MHGGFFKKKLLSTIWEKPSYARASEKEIQKQLSSNLGHLRLLEYSKRASLILDCACGDGRVLFHLWRKDARFCGVDLSSRAIQAARKRLGRKVNVSLFVGDVERVAVKGGLFDLVYSSYALEHVDDPKMAILEMIRLLARGGTMIIVCPNYGSPFHPSASSPPPRMTLFSRAMRIFFKSHGAVVVEPRSLGWMKVQPKAIVEGRWEQDWDTTVEPYVQTLLPFLRRNGVEILEYSSGLERRSESSWDDLRGVSLQQLILKIFRKWFEFLGRIGIVPYLYYGPTLFVVGRKT